MKNVSVESLNKHFSRVPRVRTTHVRSPARTKDPAVLKRERVL